MVRKIGEEAEKENNKKLLQAGIKNAAATAHAAGTATAINAGGTAAAISAINNVTSCINGEKTVSEARRFNFGQENFNEIKESINSYRSYNEHRLGERAADVALCMVQDGTVSKLADSVRNVMYAEKINDSELKTNNMDELKIQSISAIAQFSVIAVEFGFSGISDAFSAGRELNRVKERAAQLECQKEEIDIKITKINVIDDYANIHLKALNKLAPYMKDYITQAVQIIKSKDNIFHLGKISVNKFTENEIDILSFTCALSQAMKAIIDSPIISKSGDVFGENKEEFQRNVDEVERKCIEMRV